MGALSLKNEYPNVYLSSISSLVPVRALSFKNKKEQQLDCIQIGIIPVGALLQAF